MSHFFDRVPSWDTVTADLPLVPLLAAAEGLAQIFDAIGSLALAPVKNDFLKNVGRLREAAAGTRTTTLASMLAAERRAGRTTGECAVVSYFWLYHSFRMIDQAFTQWATTEDELRTCFDRGYRATLYHHHSWWQVGAFQVALAGIPTRAYLTARLGHPPTDLVRAYFEGLRRTVNRLPPP